MPPGRASTRRASPPPAGSAHSAGRGSSPFPFPFPDAASGSGRAEVKSSVPSGDQPGEDSPGALRVSRRAGRPPAGSISHTADCHFVRSEFSVWTATASRVPSGDSARLPSRGSAT
jgi:hypothetical protein